MKSDLRTSPQQSSCRGAGETRKLTSVINCKSARDMVMRGVGDEPGGYQKKGWFDDEPRATPALPGGGADGGAGALWVSDASPCALRTITREC
jgi:hypothetical protein